MRTKVVACRMDVWMNERMPVSVVMDAKPN